MMALSDKNTIISSYGLDISSTSMQWEGWTPNKKYTDKLIISNLNTKTINIKIESLPTSKYFKVNNNHDEIMKIRGGHSKKIMISFRPLEIKHYSDQIILSIEDKQQTIKVSLNADIPATSLQIPSIIDFGFIAVKEAATTQFEMINNGETPIHFKWITTDSPLIFEPTQGVIDDKSQTINIRYTPPSANCVEMVVPLQVNDKHQMMHMTVKALCTYPFFKISSKVVDMGAISIGDCKKKKLKIENCSPVSSFIHIRRDMTFNDMESVFTISPTECRVEHNGFIEIEIQFKPRTVGVKYTEHCIIDTLCGYKVRFQINGKADSPKITTSLNLINFKSVEIHKHKTEVFTLTNHSSIDSHFEFINVGESEISKSSFLLTPKRGKIFAKESINITVHFKPNNAMLFNKEVYCIVHHHIPLLVQLIGVGIDDKTKFILEPELNQLQNEIKHMTDTNDVNANTVNHTDMSHKSFAQLFDMNSNSTQNVKLSTNMIQFESCSLSQGIAPYHDITLFNTNEEHLISIKWDVQSSKTSKASKTKNEFAVFPPYMDIRSLSSTDFSAAFQPSSDLMYFYDKIDCYYRYKAQQSKQVSKLGLKCASIDLFGNSFAKSSNHFTADIKLSTDRIEFTPCSLGSSIYATVKIRNLSATHPAMWRIEAKNIPTDDSDHGNETKHDAKSMFDFNPIQGYIPPNAFQLMVAKFEPTKQGSTTFDTSIIFNEDKQMIRPLQLIGMAVEPKLWIKNEIYAIPTCIGMTSVEYIDLYNASPIPIHYEWRIPSELKDNGCVTIEPLNGVLDINEKRKCVLHFSPNRISNEYRIECECYYGNDESQMEYHETLTVNACCNQSIVEFIPKQSDFGCILIDNQTTKSVFIQNNADCQLNCDFYIEAMGDNDGNLEIEPFINNCNIPPKTRTQLELNINAIYPGVHKYELIAEVKRIDGQGSITSRSNIRFDAVWPTLSVTDIQCNTQLQSKENLWSLFSVNLLNKTFLSDLTRFERNWNNVNVENENIVDQNHLNNILENKFTNVCFNFGTQQENKSNTKIYMKVHNKGSISAAMNLKYMSQLQCTPENWARKYTENEQPLFDVEPSHFELEANKSIVLCFTYHHKVCGEHETKMLLSIQNGKQITLNLLGETVANQYSPRLSISYNTIHLKPQPIGLLDKEVSTQFIPIHNISNHDLIYSVDATSISTFNDQNYDFKVFDVVHLQGAIQRNGFKNLRIKFHPIECKTYSFTLRINAEIDDKNMERIHPEATFINVPITAEGIQQYDIESLDDTKANKTCFGRSYDVKNAIRLPQCNVRLSTEILHFGLIPLRANIRKVIMIYNEQKDYPVSFKWNTQLVPYVSVKDMSGEIQPNSCAVCEIGIRSDTEAVVINECIRCVISSPHSQSTLYLKIDCIVITDSQIERNCSEIIEQNVIQTDKPIAINTSLLSPRSQKQISKMSSEAELVSIACCKELILNALNSRTVQDQLSKLSPYKPPIAMDMLNDAATKDEKAMLWKRVKDEMNDHWNMKKQLMDKTEFHHFLQYVISETMFNITAEMIENFDVENDDEIPSANMIKR
eukprot:251242_1